MHIHVNGRNLEVTDAIKAYVKEKVGKVAAHYDQIQGIDVVLTVIKNPSVSDSHIAEINCKCSATLLGLKKRQSQCMQVSTLYRTNWTVRFENSKKKIQNQKWVQNLSG